MKQKKNVEIEFTSEKTPLETLIELIDSGVIQEEIPFEVIAEHYSELLDDWYPGFPSTLRKITKKDPIRCRGRVSNGFLELQDFSTEKIAISEGMNLPEGEHDLFLRQDDQGEWSIYLASEVNDGWKCEQANLQI